MRTALRLASAAFFALALFAFPSYAQTHTEVGDAPDGAGSAQDAGSAVQIDGALASTSDVDCYVININDASNFSATTVGGPDPNLDSKLYLWNGDASGATGAIAFDDDAQEGGTLLSRLPVGNALYNTLPAGNYVICVTSYDNDPLNEIPTDIFPQGSPFNQVYPPAPTSGSTNLASWDFPGFGDSGPYSIFMTGVGGTTCDLSFNAADISYNAATRQLTVNVTVHNAGGTALGARLALDYNRNGGPPQGTKTLGSGTLPAGATVSRTLSLRVPGAAPDGNYNFLLRLVETSTGTDCDTYAETIAISAPRIGGGEVAERALDLDALKVADYAAARAAVAAAARQPGLDFEIVDGSFDASAVSATAAVSPNPFARQTEIRYDVAAPTDVRLAVYDVLGREVAVLVDGRQEAGAHSAVFDARGLAAGTYVYRLVVGNDVRTGRMTLAY